jgi:hypothetical protein
MRKRERRGERACELVSVWASTTTGRACTEQAMSIVRLRCAGSRVGGRGGRPLPLTRCLANTACKQNGVSDTRCISKYFCVSKDAVTHSLPTSDRACAQPRGHACMHARKQWPCMLQHTRAVGSEPATVDVRRGASYVSRSQAYVSRVSIRASQISCSCGSEHAWKAV